MTSREVLPAPAALVAVEAGIPFVDVAGGPLEYVDIPARHATAPPLLLLHEGLGSVSTWRDFPAELAAATGARVVAYSRHGFGRSSPRQRPYSARFIHEEATDVLPGLRTALGLHRPVLLGHSTGGSMALLDAALHPEAIAGVVALAPLVNVEESNLASIREARRIFETTDWRRKLARHHDDLQGVFYGWNDTWLDPAFRDWDIEPELRTIRCPVLAMVGLDDPYSTPAQLAAVARGAREADVKVVHMPATGHAPHRENPVAVIEAVKEFLAALPLAAESSVSSDNYTP